MDIETKINFHYQSLPKIERFNYFLSVLGTSMFWTVFFLTNFSLLLYVAGNIFEWSDKTQMFLLQTMMTCGIAMPFLAGIKLLINIILKKQHDKKRLTATALFDFVFVLSGIFCALFSGIILGIIKGRL
ncbi:MAG: hypothetical protein Ta2B_05860 [Termitinemataceae bacterium]|nr:MAG: hypothetical protein Ta2B_05860 [Termitinemataceae bacterium]